MIEMRDAQDIAKLLGDPKALEKRLSQLREPHIAALSDFVEKLRIQTGTTAVIPYLDPWDGGTEAEILFLLEAPGPKANHSGFISRNNPDETAKNFFEMTNSAGISRKVTVVWNVVPWYIGTGKKIRPATCADIRAGLGSLYSLLDLLPKLRVIVMLGRKAEQALPYLKQYQRNLILLSCPHPSPQCINRTPGNRQKISVILKEAATLLNKSG